MTTNIKALNEQLIALAVELDSMAAQIIDLPEIHQKMTRRAELVREAIACIGDFERFLVWSEGQYPDDTPGDVIAAWPDGTVMLDDSIVVWNPLRALQFIQTGGIRKVSISTQNYGEP